VDSLKLLRWYSRHRRDLPWRQTSDPYRIWVSEVFLQQTRVDQAIPYYERFLRLFPTLDALAAAGLDDVLKAWEGAGYYSRARNLHQAARMALEKWGCLPSTYDDWLTLPGVGPYIAAAVSSIAFAEEKAVLDGNVIRVASRLTAEKGDVSTPSVRKKLLAFVQGHLPSGHASEYNQALMELGATVCLPKNPACGSCPLKSDCNAFARGWQDRFSREENEDRCSPFRHRLRRHPPQRRAHIDLPTHAVRLVGRLVGVSRRQGRRRRVFGGSREEGSAGGNRRARKYRAEDCRGEARLLAFQDHAARVRSGLRVRNAQGVRLPRRQMGESDRFGLVRVSEGEPTSAGVVELTAASFGFKRFSCVWFA